MLEIPDFKEVLNIGGFIKQLKKSAKYKNKFVFVQWDSLLLTMLSLNV